MDNQEEVTIYKHNCPNCESIIEGTDKELTNLAFNNHLIECLPVLVSCCDHCGEDAQHFYECNHCLRQVCVKCIIIGNSKQSCVDCYSQVFGGTQLGETLYVIYPQTRS